MEFNNLKARWEHLASFVSQEISTQFESGQWIQGKQVEDFEESLRQELKAPFLKSCASGTDAVWLALELAGVGRGDEVILPPVTYAATLQAVLRVGATPIFADVESETWTLDPQSVFEQLTERTRAVIAVNLAGLPADLMSLSQLTRSQGLTLIEDNAQGLGAEIEWRPSHFYADMTAYSFFPSKNLGALGDGGALLVQEHFPKFQEAQAQLNTLCHQGFNGEGQLVAKGWNSRLDAIQAIALKAFLPSLKQERQMQNTWRVRFEEYFESLGDEKIRFRLQRVGEDLDPAWSLLGVWVDQGRDDLVAYLNQQGIPARVYYSPALHQSPLITNLEMKPLGIEKDLKVSLEVSEKLVKGWFFLPFHSHLTEDEFGLICESILEWRDHHA